MILLSDDEILINLAEANTRLNSAVNSTTHEGGTYNATMSVAASNLIIAEYLRRISERK